MCQCHWGCDDASGDFQFPIPPCPRTVIAGSHIRPRERCQGADELCAVTAFSGVAGVDQQVACCRQAPAQRRQQGLYLGPLKRRVVKEGATQPQLTGAAVGDDLHRAHVTAFTQCGGHLRQAILPSLQKHHLGAGLQALQQGGGVLYTAVDEDDAAGEAGGLGNVGHGVLPRDILVFLASSAYASSASSYQI